MIDNSGKIKRSKPMCPLTQKLCSKPCMWMVWDSVGRVSCAVSLIAKSLVLQQHPGSIIKGSLK